MFRFTKKHNQGATSSVQLKLYSRQEHWYQICNFS